MPMVRPRVHLLQQEIKNHFAVVCRQRRYTGTAVRHLNVDDSDAYDNPNEHTFLPVTVIDGHEESEDNVRKTVMNTKAIDAATAAESQEMSQIFSELEV